jgi:hypothetical protein
MDYDERSAGLTPSNMMAVDKDLAFAHSPLLIGSLKSFASQGTVFQALQL